MPQRTPPELERAAPVSAPLLAEVVRTIRDTTGLSLPCPTSGDEDGGLMLHGVVPEVSRPQVAEALEPARALLAGLPLAPFRAGAIAASASVFWARQPRCPVAVERALIRYFGFIVSVQEYEHEDKVRQEFVAQCDALVAVLHGTATVSELRAAAARPLPVGAPRLLGPALLDCLENLLDDVSEAAAEHHLQASMVERFRREVARSIRVCHPPSLGERASLQGYLDQASASCMALPAVVLLCAGSPIHAETLDAHAETLTLSLLGMRISNDVLSIARERRAGGPEYARNIVGLLERAGACHEVAVATAARLYHVVLHASRDASLDRGPPRLIAALEYMNDMPLQIARLFRRGHA